MDVLRTLFALACFLVGCYFLYSLFALGFELAHLLACILAFVAAHLLLPKTKERRQEAWQGLDWLELIIDIPYQLCAWLVRLVGRLFGGKDGIDLDF